MFLGLDQYRIAVQDAPLMYKSLPDFIVSLTLQYLSPPTHPIPTHLVSRPLQQRHRYLELDPSVDPVTYYCWPSPKHDGQQVITALEQLGRHDADQLIGRVVYDVDMDETRARVQLGDNLQLVFLWEDGDQEGWRYHDAALLPFPDHCHPTLQAALAAQLPLPPDQKKADSRSGTSSPSSDAYWNGYGSTPPSPRQHPNPLIDEASEDTYWAQYSAIQGSGDSTVPSPVRRPDQPLPALALVPAGDEMSQYLQQELAISVASPQGLSLTLNTPPPTLPTIRTNLPSIYHSTDSTLQPTWLKSPMLSAISPKISTLHLIQEEDGTTEAIRGLFRMWKASGGGGEDRTPAEFIAVVTAVVGQL